MKKTNRRNNKSTLAERAAHDSLNPPSLATEPVAQSARELAGRVRAGTAGMAELEGFLDQVLT